MSSCVLRTAGSTVAKGSVAYQKYSQGPKMAPGTAPVLHETVEEHPKTTSNKALAGNRPKKKSGRWVREANGLSGASTTR